MFGSRDDQPSRFRHGGLSVDAPPPWNLQGRCVILRSNIRQQAVQQRYPGLPPFCSSRSWIAPRLGLLALESIGRRRSGERTGVLREMVGPPLHRLCQHGGRI